MGLIAAFQGDVQQTGNLPVIDKGAVADQQPRILEPINPGADIARPDVRRHVPILKFMSRH
jgi:hypothetical protein